jgi:hypothetical protein
MVSGCVLLEGRRMAVSRWCREKQSRRRRGRVLFDNHNRMPFNIANTMFGHTRMHTRKQTVTSRVSGASNRPSFCCSPQVPHYQTTLMGAVAGQQHASTPHAAASRSDQPSLPPRLILHPQGKSERLLPSQPLSVTQRHQLATHVRTGRRRVRPASGLLIARKRSRLVSVTAQHSIINGQACTHWNRGLTITAGALTTRRPARRRSRRPHCSSD